MTNRLEQAISELRSLPEADHDRAVELIRSIVLRRDSGDGYQLSPEQVAGIETTLADLDAGRTRLLAVEETAEMWRRFGV